MMPSYATLFLRSMAVIVALATPSWAAAQSQPASQAAPSSEGDHPPIPVTFKLDEPGFVTLVIEDANGNRVKNLIGETQFAAGLHTVWWDGMDESGIVRLTPNFLYRVQGKRVSPGTYAVRGLTRKGIDLRYEMTVNCPGRTPWETEDRSGAWLADHSPQTSVLFLPDGSPHGKGPQMLLGSSVAEGGSSLAWVDMDGNKLYGSKASGWQGAHDLARDSGSDARKDMSAYSVFYNNGVHLFGLAADGNAILLYRHDSNTEYKRDDQNKLSLAVYNGMAVISLPPENKLLLVDLKAAGAKGGLAAKLMASLDLPAPAGVLADAAGKALAVSGVQVVSLDVDWSGGKLSLGKPIITDGLEDPHKLTLDKQGNLYVSDWGNSQQVKVFGPQGKLIKAFGKAGPLQVGPYDPNGMTQPNGIALSADGRLWVAECSYLPKRMSIWSPEGKLLQSFIGPSPYAGGGILDSKDKTRFYFAPHSGSLEFALDWDKGTYELKNVLFRPNTGRLEIHDKDNSCQTPHLAVYADGRQYMSNIYNENDGPSAAGIWQVLNGQAKLVAAVGNVRTWSVVDELVMKDNWLASHLPEGVKMNPVTINGKVIPLFNRQVGAEKPQRVNLMFAWSDLNNDEKVQLDEMTFTWANHPAGGFVVGDGLTVTAAMGEQLAPTGFTDVGVPVFDAAQVKRLVSDKLEFATANRQPVVGNDGWLVVTGGPIEGFKDGQKKWIYHSQWPTGMSKGHSPKPQFGGQLLNTMDLLGPAVRPTAGEGGDLWAINGDYGDLFMLTTDGLFVATLFKDTRLAGSPYWPNPAVRNMLLNDCTLLAECYYPTMMQTSDGKVYLQAGKNRSSIVRVDGLESIRRLKAPDLVLTPQTLQQAKDYVDRAEEQRQKSVEDKPLLVKILKQPPVIDGNLSDWARADWVQVDDKTTAAVAVDGNCLYAAFRTQYDLPLDNLPDSIQTIFKGGEALDLMIGADPNADANRKAPAAGDVRVTLTRIKKAKAAVLFRAVVAGAKDPTVYESPVGKCSIDQVEDIAPAVQIEGQTRSEKKSTYDIRKYYEYEVSVPLSALGLKPVDGMTIRGDIGILRGRPGLTGERLYWHNKAAGQTADLPTEARLTPNLWGIWKFIADGNAPSKPAPPNSPVKKDNLQLE